jgi:hypothetical protein
LQALRGAGIIIRKSNFFICVKRKHRGNSEVNKRAEGANTINKKERDQYGGVIGVMVVLKKR